MTEATFTPPEHTAADRALRAGPPPGLAEPAPPHGYVAQGHAEALRTRLRRIEGQVRGVEKMIAEGRYCIDVLTQIAAVKAALDTVASILLEDHVNHCVRAALSSGEDHVAAEKVKELLDAVQRFAKTR